MSAASATRQIAYPTRTNTLTFFFSNNNYNEDFIRRNAHRPTATTETNDTATLTTKATIPFIKGLSENNPRILQPFNIRVAHKHITTLSQPVTQKQGRTEEQSESGFK